MCQALCLGKGCRAKYNDQCPCLRACFLEKKKILSQGRYSLISFSVEYSFAILPVSPNYNNYSSSAKLKVTPHPNASAPSTKFGTHILHLCNTFYLLLHSNHHVFHSVNIFLPYYICKCLKSKDYHQSNLLYTWHGTHRPAHFK